MDTAELSEGELQDSSESSRASSVCDDNSPDAETPPPGKKLKGAVEDYAQPGLYGKSGGGGLTGRQRKRMRQAELRRVEQEKKRQQEMAAKASQPLQESLTLHQVEILKGLVSLNRGESIASKVPKLKTTNFQGLISHLVCGSPPTLRSLPGDDELRQNRVVVAWLTMISEDFFKSSDSRFTKLKSLSPSLKFKVEHSGSARFVKSGLESFFCSSTNSEPPKPKATPSSVKPTRASYLLSKDDMFSHGFPVPGSSSLPDASKYTKVSSWPEVDPPAALESKAAPMFAVDCEMVETKLGSELARVSIVDESLTCVYDSLVKPGNPILDYRTQWSGIDQETLQDVTVTLAEVQQKILELVPSNSILLGHSLDNDLHALQFYHPFVIDTSCIFTPNSSPNNKPGLRRLARDLLNMEIQNGAKGHNSIEDAATCMRLVQLKIQSGPSCTISFNQGAPNVITEYRTYGKNTGIIDRTGVVRFFGRGASCSYEVETDKACIEEALKIIPQCDFTFLQLHDMEMLYKGTRTNSTEDEVASVLDDNIIRLVEGCPEGTLLFVVCGSGDIREVRKLQQNEFADPADLKKAVMSARGALAVALVVS